MMANVKAKWVARGLIIAAVLVVLVFAGVLAARIASRSFLISMAHSYEQYARPVALYGKVVDHLGRPLEGVSVTLNVQAPNWPTAIWKGDFDRFLTVTLTTDSDGRIDYDRESGLSIRVENVEKSGYTWIMPEDVHVIEFYYSRMQEPHTHDADPHDPYIFRMMDEELYQRKKRDERNREIIKQLNE